MGDATKRFKVSFEVEVLEEIIDEFGLTVETMRQDVIEVVGDSLVREDFISNVKVEAV